MKTEEIEALRKLVEAAPACELQPREFFIAWHGVPALAFAGFPPAIIALKKNIARSFPRLAPENSGSLWPKTSLGARQGDAPPVSLEELRALRGLCDAANDHLRDVRPQRLDSLQCIAFACRSLEKIRASHVLPLGEPAVVDPPAKEETRRVAGIMSEFARENLEDYLAAAARPGGSITHYREEHRDHTLAFMLPKVPDCIQAFREELDRALPRMYEWFADDALHITIRSLRTLP